MPNTPPTRVRALGMLALAASAVLTGCATPANLDLAGPPYPLEAPQDAVLNIQVFRDDTSIRYTNTTAATLPAGRLWLNRWYSREVEPLPIGESVELPVDEFRDRFGAAFRRGGFFAAQRPDVLVQAQIQTDEGRMLGLIVVQPESGG